jgi:hypothetical protein
MESTSKEEKEGLSRKETTIRSGCSTMTMSQKRRTMGTKRLKIGRMGEE